MDTTNLSLEQRIQMLEDKDAIKELKYRYFQGLDLRRPEQVRSIFDPGEILIDFGEWGQFTHVDQFIERFIEDECRPVVIDTHHGHNFKIELTSPTTANVVLDLHHAQLRKDERFYLMEGCYYEEEYVKHSGRWWIKKLKFTVVNEVVFDIAADGALAMRGMTA